MSEKTNTPLVRSICVDTLTQIQENDFMLSKTKPGHDKWKDYSQDIYAFILALQDLGFEIILIIGPPGVGKSSGMASLEPYTNIWYNADNKNPVWSGGRAIYGKKTKPTPNYHVIPKSYNDILTHVHGAIEAGIMAEDRYAILTGHTETFKEGVEQRVRLKTLGNLATKMQVEGKLETVMYANVEKSSSGLDYILETQNSGYNTARSHQGAFEGKIPNDYKLILDRMEEVL